jgi:hypothetical protein
METLLEFPFPIFSKNPRILATKPIKPLEVSIEPQPPDFDFR